MRRVRADGRCRLLSSPHTFAAIGPWRDTEPPPPARPANAGRLLSAGQGGAAPRAWWSVVPFRPNFRAFKFCDGSPPQTRGYGQPPRRFCGGSAARAKALGLHGSVLA